MILHKLHSATIIMQYVIVAFFYNEKKGKINLLPIYLALLNPFILIVKALYSMRGKVTNVDK